MQDLGRPGYLRVGIPASGPVDAGAFVLANRLVGNADGAAGLECTLIGPRVEFTDERRVAVTGADMAAALTLGPAKSGVRAYLGLRRPARRAWLQPHAGSKAAMAPAVGPSEHY